jgi:hypothetical protein
MRQLPEDRINSVLASGSDVHRFMTEIEVLITKARDLISFRPREHKKAPRSTSATPEFGARDLAGRRSTFLIDASVNRSETG